MKLINVCLAFSFLNSIYVVGFLVTAEFTKQPEGTYLCTNLDVFTSTTEAVEGGAIQTGESDAGVTTVKKEFNIISETLIENKRRLIVFKNKYFRRKHKFFDTTLFESLKPMESPSEGCILFNKISNDNVICKDDGSTIINKYTTPGHPKADYIPLLLLMIETNIPIICDFNMSYFLEGAKLIWERNYTYLYALYADIKERKNTSDEVLFETTLFKDFLQTETNIIDIAILMNDSSIFEEMPLRKAIYDKKINEHRILQAYKRFLDLIYDDLAYKCLKNSNENLFRGVIDYSGPYLYNNFRIRII